MIPFLRQVKTTLTKDVGVRESAVRTGLGKTKGKKYEIFLKGYASPLANSEYNYILGQRRVYSVKNEDEYLRKYSILHKDFKIGSFFSRFFK